LRRRRRDLTELTPFTLFTAPPLRATLITARRANPHGARSLWCLNTRKIKAVNIIFTRSKRCRIAGGADAERGEGEAGVTSALLRSAWVAGSYAELTVLKAKEATATTVALARLALSGALKRLTTPTARYRGAREPARALTIRFTKA
jgi:hypothetical protein